MMILLQKIKNVGFLKLMNNVLYFINSKTRELNVINESLSSQSLTKKKVDNYIIVSNSIIFQSENAIFKLAFGEILTQNEKGYIGLQEFLFENKAVIAITNSNEWLASSMLLLSEEGGVEKLNFVFNPEIQIDNNYFNHNNQSVFANTNLHQEIWKVDVLNFGRDIAKDPETGKVLWDKPNEIKEDLLADNNNIYVPLKGGQLLALCNKTGKVVWMWEHPRNGKFAIQGEFVYKQDGLTIFEISTETGDLNRKKSFNDDVLVEDFHASGPLWVYKDILIVCDVLYGKVCIINKSTLGVEDFFSLDKKLVNSQNAILWNDNKLYILDLEQTLHIFEKDQNEAS